MQTSTLATLQEINLDIIISRDEEIKKAIIKTLAYFDIFDYPLSGWEIYYYLWLRQLADSEKINYLDVKQGLESDLDQVGYKEHYYFLAGREALVDTRKQRRGIAEEKYQKVRWALKLLSVLPFIKMIAVCNSLAYNNVRNESDIDLFIITAENKIWTARFYVNLLLKVLGARPKENDKKDKICSNFFVAENNLDLQNLTCLADCKSGRAIENDIYFIYWLKQLVPVYEQGDVSKKLIAQNQWIDKFLNTGLEQFDISRRMAAGNLSRIIKWILEKLNRLGFIENVLRAIQKKIMPEKILNRANKNTEVVISDRVLKFHIDDRRAEYWHRFESKTKQLFEI